MPEGAVYVGRGSAWGNDYRVGMNEWYGSRVFIDRQMAVRLFRNYASERANRDPAWLDPLRDATALACWCPLDQPCHADVLIELLTA